MLSDVSVTFEVGVVRMLMRAVTFSWASSWRGVRSAPAQVPDCLGASILFLVGSDYLSRHLCIHSVTELLF